MRNGPGVGEVAVAESLENGNGHKLKALHDSVLFSITARAAVIFVTVIALPFGLWLGNRLVESIDAQSALLQRVVERLIIVETKIEFIQGGR